MNKPVVRNDTLTFLKYHLNKLVLIFKGLALSGGMCSYRDMKAVVGSIGLSSSAIAAHENFHK